jgi:hypothetical protein
MPTELHRACHGGNGRFGHRAEVRRNAGQRQSMVDAAAFVDTVKPNRCIALSGVSATLNAIRNQRSHSYLVQQGLRVNVQDAQNRWVRRFRERELVVDIQ